MISIQDLGLSILSDTPKHLYIIGGSEYGVKDKYIEKLTTLYGASSEYPDMDSIISLFSVRHLVPLKPQLYVVRYDEQFVSSINATLAAKIKSLKIVGTVVCLYSDSKQIEKLDKFLPESVAVIENVNPQFIEKYLHSDFPKLDDRSIHVATLAASNYGHARNICKSMSYADPEVLARMSDIQLATLFGCSQAVAEEEFRKYIAGKNFPALIKLLDVYEGEYDSLLYTILQTMIDLEKILSSKYPNSDLKDFIKLWTVEDIYYMFMNTYDEISKLRSSTAADAKNSLIYLFGLLPFQRIPSTEVLNAV